MKIQTNFFLRGTIKASACEITQAKTKDGTIGTFSTQRLFKGFFVTCKQLQQY